MSKLNRRDYLSLIGASGAGLMFGAACRNDSQQQTGQGPAPTHTPMASPDAARARPAPPAICSNGFKDWPPSTDAPSRCASVTLIFDGLMGYFYDHGQAQVAFHPAGNMHKPSISLWEKPDDSACGQAGCTDQRFPALPAKLKYIDVSVVGRQNKVDYYKPGACLDRGSGNPMDFRWLIDLEELYSPPHGRRKHFGLVLRIQDGTFYTRTLTNHIFQRVDSRNRLSQQAGTIIGRVPHIMAAAIKLTGDEKVRLELKDKDNKPLGNPTDLKPATQKVLELDFLNRCVECEDPNPCHDSDETKRNHFHYLRKVLELESDLPKYSIALAASETEPLPIPPKCNAEGLTERTDGDYCSAPHAELTDEAPCAGSGYGGSGCGC